MDVFDALKKLCVWQFVSRISENSEKMFDNYLQNDSEGQFTRQITNLLCDESSDNAPLVLELIRGGGVNRRLLGYLFGLSVFHAKKETAGLAMSLLQQHAGAETLRQAQKLRESVNYYYNESEYFSKFDNPEFDLFDFILAYKMCAWHRSSGALSGYNLISHQTLNLSQYPFATLSPGISTLHFIRYIALPAHRLFDFEASIPYLSALPLESVFIENTRLEHFPVSLLRLPTLRTLSIRRGTHRPKQAMQVPENGIFGSESLEKLLIDAYPVEGEARLGPFPALRECVMNRCALTSLDFLKASSGLLVLGARFNRLESLPAFLSELSLLERLELGGNPFKEIQLDLSKLLKMNHLEIGFTHNHG